MIARRCLLASAAAVFTAGSARAAPAIPHGGRLAFRVVRDGDAIGSHVLTFARHDNGLDIRVAVDIAVSLGPIVVFRYTLRGLEQWRGGDVVHVEATTDDDGTPASMRADRTNGGLWVQGSKASRYLAPPNALPATHWNMAELDGPWINPQDGRLFHPRVARDGAAQIALADGRSEIANKFTVSGDVDMTLFYNTARRWSALHFAAKDGSQVRYELM